MFAEDKFVNVWISSKIHFYQKRDSKNKNKDLFTFKLRQLVDFALMVRQNK